MIEKLQFWKRKNSYFQTTVHRHSSLYKEFIDVMKDYQKSDLIKQRERRSLSLSFQLKIHCLEVRDLKDIKVTLDEFQV